MSSAAMNQNDPKEKLKLLQQLVYKLKLDEAEDFCNECLALHEDFRDDYGHPAFLKEKFRLALLGLRHNEARQLADRLQGLLRPNDPAVSVLFARFHARMGDREAAKQEWTRVLSMAPNHKEAMLGLKAAEVLSIVVDGVTMVPL